MSNEELRLRKIILEHIESMRRLIEFSGMSVNSSKLDSYLELLRDEALRGLPSKIIDSKSITVI